MNPLHSEHPDRFGDSSPTGDAEMHLLLLGRAVFSRLVPVS